MHVTASTACRPGSTEIGTPADQRVEVSEGSCRGRLFAGHQQHAVRDEQLLSGRDARAADADSTAFADSGELREAGAAEVAEAVGTQTRESGKRPRLACPSTTPAGLTRFSSRRARAAASAPSSRA